METVHHRRSVGCGLTDAMYEEVRKAALKRGITVSELVRHYIEEGLSNPTPAEIRRLNDRLSTMEGAIKELYEIAVMNWGSVESEPKKNVKLAMPWEPEFHLEPKKEGARTAVKWMPEFLDKWKNKLSGKGLVNEKKEKLHMRSLLIEHRISMRKGAHIT